MAKILVADDNSNIQRMVGLALKDQGIEVVAVGNGEAAVRKISELRPDLVLADVFMPVRNGYEVCEYVKQDEALKHIPVILLVGAFDPLDEQEAQRVGADGVLKKPFVPPDPLIAMVKAALERAGVSLTPASASKPIVAPARKAADLLPAAQSSPAQSPAAQSAPPPTAQRASPLGGIAFSGSSVSGASLASGAAPPFASIVADESFVETPAQPAVDAEAASHTIAFGNLLGSAPATEDPGFSVEDMEAVTGKDWRSLEETVDVPEEQDEPSSKESVPSWRREESESFVADDGSGPVRDWRDAADVEPAGRKSAREIWEQAEDKDGFAKATEGSSAMASFTSELSALEAETTEAKNQGSVEVGEPETAVADVATGPEIPAMNLPVGTSFGTGAGTDAQAGAEAHAQSANEFVSEGRAAEAPAEPAIVEEPPVAQEMPAPAEVSAGSTELKSATNSWFSTPSSPWDTDAQQTNKLTASWDGGGAAAAGGASATTGEHVAETRSNGESSHEDITAVLADEPAASTSEAAAPTAAPAVTTAATHIAQGGPGTEAEMDALIAKVLARLNPEALNAMAQQILKPAVAAILAEELKSKK